MTMMTTAARTRIALTVGGLAICSMAWAQYKSIGPDGIVTYSDTPPPPTSRIVNEKKTNVGASTSPALPYEVQTAASKYPVVIYTGDNCSPCNDARAYLRSRGIPFTEKTVKSDDDIALFRQQSPDGTAPLVTVGSRKSFGFSQAALSSVLDNAGYPATNTLPRDYQNPDPTPLAPSPPGRAAVAGAQASAPVGRPTAPPEASPAPNTPPGFRF